MSAVKEKSETQIKRTGKSKYTKEMCIESALQFKIQKDWIANARRYHQAARRKGWLADCCLHMKQKLNIEDCKAIALLYSTRTAFSKGHNLHYATCQRHEWLDIVCAHMIKKYTKEACLASASQYTSYKQWRTEQTNFYNACQVNKWLAECKILINPKLKHTVISNTKDRKRKYTKEVCKIEALKYTTRSQWQAEGVHTYRAARRSKWLDECCQHMKQRPSKENILVSLQGFTQWATWAAKYPAFYDKCSRKRWIPECRAIIAQNLLNTLQ